MSDKIKVLIDTSPLSNANQIRGVGSYTRFLSQELDHLEEVKIERSTHQTAEGFDPDVIHYPFFDLFFPTLPVLKNRPTVVTIHDLIPLVFPKHYPAGIKGSLAYKKQLLSLKTVSAIITDSSSSKADIVRLLSVSPDKVHAVYLAGNPDVSLVSQNKIKIVRSKYHLPKNYVLYVGDINYNKNIPQLIKAVKYLPKKVQLVLLGKNFKPQDIPEWDWIEAQLSLSDVSQRVHFVNDVNLSDIDDLSAIYAGAVCYAQPSLYEGFGLPVLEAMQAHTPVVCSSNSSLKEVGGDYAVFTAESAENIAEGIKQVLSWSEETRNKFVMDAADWASTFSWEKTARETTRVYRQVLQ